MVITLTDWLVVGMAGWLLEHAEQLAVTVLTLAVILGAKLRLTRWRRDRELRPLFALSLSALLAVVTAGGLFGLIALWGLGVELQRAYSGIELQTQLTNIVLSFVILGAAYALSDFVGHVVKDLVTDHRSVGVHEREILHRVSQVTIYTFAVLVVVGLFTDNVGGLLVGAGFLGIVVGMAARQTLGAVLAGFVIMFSKPFEVGDWIVVGENEGTVTEITIVNTRIQSFDGEYIMIPNDVVTAKSVTNRTRRGQLRLEVAVSIDYETDVDHATSVALDAVADLDRILEAPSPRVDGKEFDTSSIVLAVRGWIDRPSARKRWQTRTEMIAAIKTAFDEAGITIPDPQRELTGRAEAGGFRVTDEAAAAGDGRTAVDSDGNTIDGGRRATDGDPNTEGTDR